MSFVDTNKWTDATTRVLVCEDRAVLRRYVIIALEAHTDVEVVGEAADLASILTIGEHHEADVVITSATVGAYSASEVLAGLHDVMPAARGLVVGPFDDDADSIGAIRHGAIGFLHHDTVVDQCVAGVHDAMLGRPFLPPEAIRLVIDEFAALARPAGGDRSRLRPVKPTDRERAVLELLAAGASFEDAADELAMRSDTASNLVANALCKLVRWQQAEDALAASLAAAGDSA